jgi:hypothetical protein
MACVASGHFFEREDKLLKSRVIGNLPSWRPGYGPSYRESRFSRAWPSALVVRQIGWKCLE